MKHLIIASIVEVSLLASRRLGSPSVLDTSKFSPLCYKEEKENHMNYSDYFENKVAAALSNKFNLIVVKTKANTELDFISESLILDSMKEVWSSIAALDPYSISLVNNTITAKVMDYGKEKVQ
jgi:hypothetical protein